MVLCTLTTATLFHFKCQPNYQKGDRKKTGCLAVSAAMSVWRAQVRPTVTWTPKNLNLLPDGGGVKPITSISADISPFIIYLYFITSTLSLYLCALCVCFSGHRSCFNIYSRCWVPVPTNNYTCEGLNCVCLPVFRIQMLRLQTRRNKGAVKTYRPAPDMLPGTY